MIKTRTVFVIFIFLLLFIFPYSILIFCLNSDFLSSIIPGWNTIIYPIGALFKFFVLLFVSFYYWKLSKTVNKISLKKFMIHFLLTIPGVFIMRLNLYQLFNSENFIIQIKTIIFIKTFASILFFLGQILFWIYYKKITKKLT